jgi:hypothetical protein
MLTLEEEVERQLEATVVLDRIVVRRVAASPLKSHATHHALGCNYNKPSIMSEPAMRVLSANWQLAS